MAAVTKGTLRPLRSDPVHNRIGKASAILAVGDPVVIDAAAAVDPEFQCSYKKAASETFVDGIVLKPAVAGGKVEVGTFCEITGFSGLTIAAKLTVVSGNIDNTAPAAGERGQFQAINATTIEFRK